MLKPGRIFLFCLQCTLIDCLAPGESAVIAEEMAARDAIKNLLNTQDNRKPLVFGDKLREIELNYDKLNPSVKDLMT